MRNKELKRDEKRVTPTDASLESSLRINLQNLQIEEKRRRQGDNPRRRRRSRRERRRRSRRK